jgi:hypothetical protein
MVADSVDMLETANDPSKHVLHSTGGFIAPAKLNWAD